MSTASDTPARAPGASPDELNAARRRRLALWLLLLVVAAVVAAVLVKQRWDGFRDDAIDHDRNAKEYTRVAGFYHQQIETFGRKAEAIEKAAAAVDHDFMIGPLRIAEEDRQHEAEARGQEAYYVKKSGEEKDLAAAARTRW